MNSENGNIIQCVDFLNGRTEFVKYEICSDTIAELHYKLREAEGKLKDYETRRIHLADNAKRIAEVEEENEKLKVIISFLRNEILTGGGGHE